MRKQMVMLLCLLVIVSSVAAQKLSKTEKSLLDFEGAVYEVETNYAGFSYKTSSEQKLKEYNTLKERLQREIKEDGREGYEAVGELYGWFGDRHLRTALGSHIKYRKLRTEFVSAKEGMEEYNPTATTCKVDDDTFLIRFPSCGGDPDMKWIEASVKSYLASGCKHLIIDIRGNGGGRDTYYEPYVKLLYEKEGVSEGVDIRNSPDNIAYMKTVIERLPWVADVVKTAESSKEDFIPLVENDTIKYDTIHPLPLKAAIIIDSNVASSGEQMILDIRASSPRTQIYGKGNTMGCLDFSNIRRVDLKKCGISTWIPMTRSKRLPEYGVDDMGIAPDVRIDLPLPKVLTDNIDEWVKWVAEDMKR